MNELKADTFAKRPSLQGQMKPTGIRRDSVDELHNGKSKQKGSPQKEGVEPQKCGQT